MGGDLRQVGGDFLAKALDPEGPPPSTENPAQSTTVPHLTKNTYTLINYPEFLAPNSKNVWKSDKSWEPEKIWKFENLKIWKFENLKIWKFKNLNSKFKMA